MIYFLKVTLVGRYMWRYVASCIMFRVYNRCWMADMLHAIPTSFCLFFASAALPLVIQASGIHHHPSICGSISSAWIFLFILLLFLRLLSAGWLFGVTSNTTCAFDYCSLLGFIISIQSAAVYGKARRREKRVILKSMKYRFSHLFIFRRASSAISFQSPYERSLVELQFNSDKVCMLIQPSLVCAVCGCCSIFHNILFHFSISFELLRLRLKCSLHLHFGP